MNVRILLNCSEGTIKHSFISPVIRLYRSDIENEIWRMCVQGLKASKTKFIIKTDL